MSLRRFFFDPTNRHGDTVSISQEESRHIKTVLRLNIGDKVELLDGDGSVFLAELVVLDKYAQAKIISESQVIENKIASLWLGQAVLKGKKVDDLIPKCTELGVDTFSPFQSSRCQGKLDSVRAAKKKERWERMVESSCKQCQRSVRMQVEPISDFTEMLTTIGENVSGELRIIFWEEEKDLLLRQIDFNKEYEMIRVILGPEGGFSEEETELAKKMDWLTVSLGQRVLKAETATIAAVALLQHLAGNMG